MTSAFVIPTFFALSIISTTVEADEFLGPDDPGHRGSFGDENTSWTPELDSYLNCSLREFLNADFVEACAIFKEDGRRFLECRYYSDTYENVPSADITKQQEDVVNTCSAETLSDVQPGHTFANLLSRLFGE